MCIAEVETNMATVTLVVLALFAGATCSAPQGSRIVGGSLASIEDYPSIVQVENMATGSGIWYQACGGSILTSRYVLSAAHCFHGIFYDTKNRRIRAGTAYSGSGGQVSSVDVEYNHPTYGQNDMDGDISVVRLSEPLEYDYGVQQGAIVPQGLQVPDELPVVLAGWGATDFGSMNSNELRETTVYTVNLEVCAERYATLPIPRTVTENMICAGLLDVGGRDACQGDYGGPMYYGGYLFGILSWGQGCGNGTLPGVSTAVSSYTDWIVATAIWI